MRPTAALCALVPLSLAVSPPARAGTLTLAHVLDVVRAESPSVRGAHARADAAAAVPARARAYDDPEVSWEAWNVPESLAVERADNNILRLSQRIPFPGKRTLAGRMAERDADVAREDATAAELDAVTAAKRAYADLWQADRKRAVLARERTLGERVARLTEQRYATGEATQTDVLRAQIELSHMVGDLRTADLDVASARAALAAVMSVPTTDVDGVPDDPPPPRLPASLGPLVERALRERPEVAARGAALAREETGRALAEKGYLPDFEVSVGRFLNHGAPNGFGAMASMTVPLAWKSKYDAGVAEADARIVSARADQRLLADGIRREVEQAYLQAQAAAVRIDLFGSTHVPHAEEAMRVTEAAYATGAVDFSALLETARNLEAVHVEHLAAGADFEKAFADLERAVGADIPRGPSRTEAHHD